MVQGQKRQRTCITCGTQTSKGELHRVVRQPDGSVSFDAAGRMPGRGAYVCSTKCLAAACMNGKLSRALRCGISSEDCERISSDLELSLREAE